MDEKYELVVSGFWSFTKRDEDHERIIQFKPGVQGVLENLKFQGTNLYLVTADKLSEFVGSHDSSIPENKILERKLSLFNSYYDEMHLDVQNKASILTELAQRHSGKRCYIGKNSVELAKSLGYYTINADQESGVFITELRKLCPLPSQS